MTPRRPYLLRALIDWIIDNGETPYVLVQVQEGVDVPPSYVNDGRIVLNLSPVAVRQLSITNDHVMFDGRFGGQSHAITVPMWAVLAVYAKESGEGMLFESEYTAAPESASQPTTDAEHEGQAVTSGEGGGGAPGPTGSDGGEGKKKPPRRRNHLTAVK